MSLLGQPEIGVLNLSLHKINDPLLLDPFRGKASLLCSEANAAGRVQVKARGYWMGIASTPIPDHQKGQVSDFWA
jgi:hypothetical protein